MAGIICLFTASSMLLDYLKITEKQSEDAIDMENH